MLRLFQLDRANAIVVLLAPWGFFALLEWRLLLALVPFLAMQMAWTTSPVGTYYLLPTISFVLFATVLGMRRLSVSPRLEPHSWQPRLAGMVAVSALVAWVFLGPVRYHGARNGDLFWPDEVDRRIVSVARAVPTDASVAVAGEMLRRFARRAEVYEFPEPVSARDPSGRVFVEPVARDADWVVVDLSMDWRASPDQLRGAVQDLLAEERYFVHMKEGPLVVLQRATGAIAVRSAGS